MILLVKYVKAQCTGTLSPKALTTAEKTFTLLEDTGDVQVPGANKGWDYWFTESGTGC